MDYVFNPEGYIRFYGAGDRVPFYYIKDHLGNVREVYVNPGPGYKLCAQRTQYYPSGLPWNETYFPSEQPFKYNGKEFIEMHSLDEYDSEARWYYPAIMRTTTMDPLCEKYYSTSPYAWCGNNPVNLVDPDGGAVYYSSDGDYLGTDDDGFMGQVFITTQELYDEYKEMTDVAAGIDLTPLQNSSLSAEVFAKIYTSILKLAGFNVDQLNNNSISVYGDVADVYNDAEILEPSALASSTIFATPAVVTVNQQSKYSYLLNTVENIQNVIGAHELVGHSILKYRDSNRTHYLAYLYQMRHPSWINTTDEFKETMKKQYNYYLKKEKP